MRPAVGQDLLGSDEEAGRHRRSRNALRVVPYRVSASEHETHPRASTCGLAHGEPGLAFAVNLNLLHLSAGHFWFEWFPCTKPDVVAAYAEAVSGVLSGTFRIVEYYRWRRVVQVDLQRPAGAGWKTIATTNPDLLFLWRTKTKVLQNRRFQ
jgi:hypothetical protein